MAETKLTAKGNGGKELREWQKQSLEMVALVNESSLAPMMAFANLIANDKEGILDVNEVGQILRLLLTGMYVDLKMCCTTAGSGSFYDGRVLDNCLSELPWQKGGDE